MKRRAATDNGDGAETKFATRLPVIPPARHRPVPAVIRAELPLAKKKVASVYHRGHQVLFL
jgi:hypothetical protein